MNTPMDYRKGTRNPDGTINIPNTPRGNFENVPYVGVYEDYREMAEDYKRMIKIYAETGYVCRADDDIETIFVLFYPMGEGLTDEYIIVE